MEPLPFMRWGPGNQKVDTLPFMCSGRGRSVGQGGLPLFFGTLREHFKCPLAVFEWFFDSD